MAQNPNLSHLDQPQIINRVFDPLEDRLRVDAEVTAVIAGPIEVAISHVDDSIRIGDSVNLVTTTTVLGDVGLDVNVLGGSITGDFSPSGLKVAIRTTTMNVTDTATALPASPLTGRNSISVENYSDQILYIGNLNVTADRALGITAGREVNPNEGFNLDITDTIVIYGIAPTGETILVKVTELA